MKNDRSAQKVRFLRSILMALSFRGARLAVLIAALCTSLQSFAIAADGFTLENLLFRIVANPSGIVTSVYGKTISTEYLLGSAPFVKARVGSTWYSCIGCTSNGSTINFTFPTAAGASLTLTALSQPSHLSFRVDSVSSSVDELWFLNFSVTASKYKGTFSGLSANDTYGIYVRTLTPTCTATTNPFVVMSKKIYGLNDAKFAIGGANYSDIRNNLKNLITTESLQSTIYSGPWALDAEINKLPYVWTKDISAANASTWASIASNGKLGIILMTDWWKTRGTYQLHDRFANGLTDLQSVVTQIHESGLKAGLRTLTAGIDPLDPYISPVPDPRLAKDASFVLAAGVSSTDQTITVNQSISNLDTVWGNKGNVLQIGNELIQYTGYTSAVPYQFTGCVRGAFGTTKTAHSSGVDAHHLFSRYSMFYPDPDSSLLDEIAENIADIINTCQFDMIYLDGADVSSKEWYGIAKAKLAIMSRINAPVRVESSIWDHSSWNLNSQIGALDYPSFAPKRFIDSHALQSQSYASGNLMPGQLGWWGFTPDTYYYPGLFPDELEYLCGKSSGLNLPMSFRLVAINPTTKSIVDNGVTVNGVADGEFSGRQNDFLAIINSYETLRLGNQLSDSMRTLLANPGYEFKIRGSTVVFASTDRHKVTGSSNGTNSWTAQNFFLTQPARFRIQALDVVGSYGASNLYLLNFPPDSFVMSNATGVTSTFAPSTEQVAIGTPSSVKFTATNSTSTRTGAWACAKKVYAPVFDMQSNFAFGVWVYGDGKGQVLNFEITNAPLITSGSEHIIPVDFVGWKYFEIPIRECDAEEYLEHVWPLSPAHDIYRAAPSRNTANNGIAIAELNIYMNNLPADGQTAQCYISPIKALPIRYANLSNLALSIGGTQVTFPVQLQSRQYIEFNSMFDCKLYSKDGFLLQNLAPQGNHPSLLTGYNAVILTATPQSGYNLRANISIFSDEAASSDLIAGWSFGQSGNSANDLSANNNLASLLNGASQTTATDWPALILDGINDYAAVPSNSSLKYQGGAMSLCTWIFINPTETTGGYILSKPWNGSGQYNYSLGLTADRRPFFGVGFPSSSTITGLKSLKAGVWHYLAATVDSSPSKVIALYLDGKLVASGMYGSWQPTSSDQNLPFAIGTLFPYTSGWTGNTSFSFDGKISGPQIYSRVLSMREIAGMASLDGNWNFDTTSPVTDLSGNGNSATLMNSPSAPVGISGTALGLDGINDYASVSATPALEFRGEELTLSAWINIDASETNGGYLISKPWNRSGDYNYVLGLTASRQVFLGIGFHWDWNNVTTTTMQISTGGWHHIAATVDSTRQTKIYVDGVLSASGSYLGWSPVNGNASEALIIGSLLQYAPGWSGNTALCFYGKIDNVEIHNKALSADDILALYEQ